MTRRDDGMSCRRVRELLPRYVDQDLPAHDAVQVAAHLKGCPACRRRLAVHHTLLEALPGLPTPALAPELEARLRRRVREGVEAARQRRSRWGALERLGNAAGWVAATAVALLLVVGLVLSGRPLVAARWGTARPTATATQAPLPAMGRYESTDLGFAVDYPTTWTVGDGAARINVLGWPELGGVSFTSDGYAGGSQAYGRYVIDVIVYDAGGQTVDEAVAAWLAPIDPSYRQEIEQRDLEVAGVLAIELRNLPGPPLGRAVWLVHQGRLYVLQFTPQEPYEGDAVAQAAYDAFLRTFALTSIAETPVPPTSAPTAAPTPTSAPITVPTTMLTPLPPTPNPSPTPAPSPTLTTALPPYARPVTSLIVTPDQLPLVYAVVDGQLCRSADRGNTWTAEPGPELGEGAQLTAVVVDYRHSQTMYALTTEGIYRREGTGAWAPVTGLQATALAVDMLDPNVLWAGVEQTTPGTPVIMQSNDGGISWMPAGLQVEVSPLGTWASDILVNPRDPDMIWAVVRSNQPGLAPTGRLFRGTRDGDWQQLSLGAFDPDVGNLDGVNATGIAYDPNANLLYVGGERAQDNAGRVLLIRSSNPDTADATAVRWGVVHYFAQPAEPCDAPGLVRPLAVDAQAPRAVYLASDIVACGDESPLDRHRLLVSHDDGVTWDTLPLTGLP